MSRRRAGDRPAALGLLLRIWLSRDRDEGYLGDVEEQYADCLESDGRTRARRWLRREIVRALPRFIGESVRWRIGMFGNYLKIALRNLLRQKGFSFINVAGLAAGMASCLLIFLYVSRERGYDRHHPDHARVFRASVVYESGRSSQEFALDPFPLAPALVAEYPEVEIAGRVFRAWSEMLLEYDDRKFFESGVLYADNEVLKILSIPFLKGDSRTALVRPGTAILARSLAPKYFGGADPVGKAVMINGAGPFEVTGVVEDPPPATHLKYGWIVSLESLRERMEQEFDNWFGTAAYTYLRLRPGADPRALTRKLAGLAPRHVGPRLTKLGMSCRFLLMPIADVHLNGRARYEAEPAASAAVLSLLSAAAVFILIIACLNFISLATARSVRRAREVGLRKVVGAARAQLVFQFLGESLLVSLISGAAAFVLALLARPLFNAVSGSEFLPGDLVSFRPLALVCGMALITGLGAGLYPALILSAFRPALTLKGSFKSGRLGVLLRKTLVVGQFLLTSILIAGTIVAFRQIRYMKSRDIGFSGDRILAIPVRGALNLGGRYREAKTAFKDHSFILGASASSGLPARAISNYNIRLTGGSADDNWNMYHLYIDADFIPLYGIEMAAGRAFRNDMTTDETRSYDQAAPVFLVNEAAVRAFGLAAPGEAVNRRIVTGNGGREGTIIGVVRDFHYFGLQKQVEPLVLEWFPRSFQYLSLKIAGGDLRGALKAVEGDWKVLFPGIPFESFFVDQDFDRQYRADERVLAITRTFTVLGILISCLGLFGLASYLAEQKTREIGIRKVLGATAGGIVVLFSNGFVRLVVLANALAAPAAWLVMSRWLRDYAYRIKISPGIFIAATVLSMSVAFLSVGFQSLKAALANPAESLRNE